MLAGEVEQRIRELNNLPGEQRASARARTRR
jgi:hypothetical protein